jgi:flagellar basal body-associated protein FliL
LRKDIIMEKKEKKNKIPKALLIVGGAALTVAGFIIVPPLYNKLTNKAVKKASSTDDIDFDNLGPEIVQKDASKEDDE